MHQVFLLNVNNFQRSIWHIDRTLTSSTTQGQSGPGSYSNKDTMVLYYGIKCVVNFQVSGMFFWVY